MEEGSTIDVRFGNQPVVVDPAPVDGANSWVLGVPTPAQPLVIRLCSEDEARALDWVNIYAGEAPNRLRRVARSSADGFHAAASAFAVTCSGLVAPGATAGTASWASSHPRAT